MPHVELPQTEFKVVVLGDTNVGKTSLVLRFTEGYYRENSRSPTVGAFFLTKRVQTTSGITAKVQIWDTAGQAQFRKMAPIYWRNDGAAAILLCYDVSNVHSWNVALEWLKELRYDKHVLEKNIVLALVATKSDLAYSNSNSLQDEEDVVFDHGNGNGNGGGQYYTNSNGIRQQKSKQNRMVSFNQVDQILKSFQNQTNIDTTLGMGMGIGTSSSNTAATAAAAAAAAANYNQYGIGNGNGHILHMETSARKDDNVDLLFQKVAEKVLFVREQERLVYMNHGIKYKHYGTSTAAAASSLALTAMSASASNSNSFLDNSGGSEYDFTNLQQNGAMMMPSTTSTAQQLQQQQAAAMVGPNNTSTSTMKASNIGTIMSVSEDSNYHHGYENGNANGNNNSGAVVSPSPSPPPSSSSPSRSTSTSTSPSTQSSSIGKQSRQLNFNQYDHGGNNNNNNNNKENHHQYQYSSSSSSTTNNNNTTTSTSIPTSYGHHGNHGHYGHYGRRSNDHQNSLTNSHSKEELKKLRGVQNKNNETVDDINISTGLCYGVGCGSTTNNESSSSACLIS
mmetsp:Transcript_23537/g.35003  ORF Transcript_23537/g.35003 Transcript_23537/m.35003 type:complete len:564 (+) Transcript_23537:102-1793(+)|eukprot:CAMPEP_0203678880 /NCGR_PEP_ID=MMETSP0090-20130426/33623_1 /ASSEMBLY_ACC=CAM_ASM_001088 /TAXON_ID=426623 /ORGANISM="Chaetoceros affinis, Strain CCMP159" /LENGTH=563 /DNA_ID=CAMNT_0050546317 /DNA_START=101 /DNA_END=1792 /DNA_ORIENTATION=-